MNIKKKPHFILTGSTGYIGTHLVKILINMNIELTLLTKNRENINNVNCIQYSIENALPKLPKNADIIIHLAADMDRNKITAEDEILGGIRLLNWSLDNNCRFIFISSQTAHKSSPTRYGRVKWEIEKTILNKGGYVVRPGFVFGGQEKSLYGNMVKYINNNIVIPYFIPQLYIQPIHISTLCDGIIKIGMKQNLNIKEFNLASDDKVSFSLFLRKLALSKNRNTYYIPTPNILLRISLLLASKYFNSDKSLANRFESLVHLPKLDTKNTQEQLDLKITNYCQYLS